MFISGIKLVLMALIFSWSLGAAAYADDDDMHCMRPSSIEAPVTLKYRNGTIEAIGRGSETYTLLRSAQTGAIVGVKGPDGIERMLDTAGQLHTEEQAKSKLATNPSKIARAVTESTNGIPVMNACGGSGGSGPYDSSIMSITVTAQRIPNVSFWQDSIQRLIYTPQMPVIMETPPAPGPDRGPRCTAQTNSCINSADNIASGAYAVCANLATEAAQKRGSVWGSAVFGVTAAACMGGIELVRNSARNSCFQNHAACMSGS